MENQLPNRKNGSAGKKLDARSVVVIGLGRFGTSLATELLREGREVLGIDADERIVQNMSDRLSQVVQADTTDETVLRELGIQDFDSAVVAIGSDLESSILTASLLLELGIPQVWAKATSTAHGRILEQLGVHHVIFPEMDMGKRVAHMVTGESLDYVELDKNYVMVKTEAPELFNGKTLAELKFRSKHGVTVVATKKGEGTYQPSFPETVIETGDLMVVAGNTEKVDEFCRMGL
jgi:trk system potassium uptake protein TrkA